MTRDIASGPENVAARLREVQGAGRVSDALLGVALDVLYPHASDYLSHDDYARLCELAAAPVAEATRVSLVLLVSELSRAVDSADPGSTTFLLDLTRRQPWSGIR